MQHSRALALGWAPLLNSAQREILARVLLPPAPSAASPAPSLPTSDPAGLSGALGGLSCHGGHQTPLGYPQLLGLPVPWLPLPSKILRLASALFAHQLGGWFRCYSIQLGNWWFAFLLHDRGKICGCYCFCMLRAGPLRGGKKSRNINMLR